MSICRASAPEHQNSIQQPCCPGGLGCWEPLQLQLDRRHLLQCEWSPSRDNSVSYCLFLFCMHAYVEFMHGYDVCGEPAKAAVSSLEWTAQGSEWCRAQWIIA